MNTILNIRDACINTFNRFDFILKPALKFLFAFILLLLLQSKYGYFEQLNRISVIAVFSLICAFLPLGGISFVAGLFFVADMFRLSYTASAFAASVLLVIYLLYFGFKPGTGIILSIVPLSFFLHIPYVVPIILGMNLGVFSAVPAVLGVIIWNMLKFMGASSEALSAAGTAEIADTVTGLVEGILLDRYMLMICVAFILAVIISAMISKSSINYSWITAATAGILAEAVIVIIAGIRYGSDVLIDIIGLLISFLICAVYVYTFYGADYKSTERLSFEDDDYFYYVKAVPKIKPDAHGKGTRD